MGGGSADAAAMLRCAGRLAAIDPETVARIAAGLGADVPAQLAPGPSLGTGAGEVVEPLAALAPYGVLVLPQSFALSTAEVYREADRLGLGRSVRELVALRAQVAEMLSGEGGRALAPELMVNDLQAAALSLRPELSQVLDGAREAGADHAMVCGSGPTVIGLFIGERARARARAAGADPRTWTRFGAAVAAAPVHSAQSEFRL
jgi:4-diphosphocytidyl-2-C-methyl-D-erythritol kinase